jgi:hypothetical protein
MYIFFFPLFFLFFFSVQFTSFPYIVYFYIVVIPLLALTDNYLFQMALSLLRNRYVLFLFLIYLAVAFLMLLVAFVHGSGDISIMKPILHSLAAVPSCLVIAAAMVRMGGGGQLTGFLGGLLKIQSLIIVLMLVFTEFRELIFSLLRSEAELERMSSYGGARGLGMAGSVAFGLSTIMSIVYFNYFSFKYIDNGRRFFIRDYLWLIFCGVASLSAGRTAILGIALVPAFVFIVKSANFKGIDPRSNIKSILIILSCAFLFFNLFIYIESPTVERYLLYVLEPVMHFIATGSFEVSSLKGLSNMYFDPGQSTLLFGDGRFLTSAGTYYGNTDAGYMRFILFGGAGFSFLIYMLFILFCLTYYFSIRNIVPFPSVFVFLFGFICFVFQYKGHLIFSSLYISKLVFISVFYCILVKSKYRAQLHRVQL